MAFFFRKIYFIKKDFQTRFILRFVVSATAWAIVSVILFVLIADRKLEEIRYSTHIMARTTSDVLLPTTLWVQGVTLLVFAVMLAYAIRALWTRLASPLYSLKKDISRIAAGELRSMVSLREEEEFHDLAGDVDKMRGELQQKWARIKERHEALDNAAGELGRSISKGNLSVNHAALMKEAVHRFKEEINAFKY